MVKPATKLCGNQETLCQRNLQARKLKFEMDKQKARLVISRGKIEVGDDVMVSWGGDDYKQVQGGRSQRCFGESSLCWVEHWL